ncbi:hypothetical protein ASPNIDRAFT_129639, partial [Aspergillus niger ATCC 1015]
MPATSRNQRSLRKHVTTACIPCRDGKVKCGGGTPTCRNCAIRGKTCRYRQSDDKRKVPVRPAVAVLARRVDSLVHHIRECGLPVPPIDEEDHRILKNVLDALELRCEDVVADPNDTSSRPGQANILPTTPVSVNSSAPPTQPNETDSVGPSHQPSVCLEPLDLSPDKERVAWKDSTISEAPREDEEVGDSDDEVTDQLSCRLGRLQDPSLHVIDAESFWRSRAQSREEGLATPYYSRALSDAMCALGAAYEPKYHPDFVTFPRSLAEFFGDRAKLLVELELDNPSIATIQALVILSNHEASCTRDTRGWLYSDAEVRRMVFWGVYLNEQFWGFYLGRSAQCRMDAVTVRKPMSPSPVPSSSWKPYPDQLGTSFPQIPFNPLCQEWVSLYEIMLPLTDISTHSLQELASVTVEKLQQWHLNLPAELKADEGTTVRSPLPHVLTL